MITPHSNKRRQKARFFSSEPINPESAKEFTEALIIEEIPNIIQIGTSFTILNLIAGKDWTLKLMLALLVAVLLCAYLSRKAEMRIREVYKIRRFSNIAEREEAEAYGQKVLSYVAVWSLVIFCSLALLGFLFWYLQNKIY